MEKNQTHPAAKRPGKPRGRRVLSAVLILLGICVFLYPLVSDAFYQLRFRDVVQDYDAQVQQVDSSRADGMLAEAEAFNRALAALSGDIRRLPEAMAKTYDTLLPVTDTGILGTIRIPKIGQSLPIYHGTGESELQVGIGHLMGSSLPVGGEDTHTVLTGHSGLPSRMLFTALDKLEPGDTFTITVLSRTITYQVDGLEVKLPEEVRLAIRPGEDLATLITCTPVGLNTHRLLVHAHRIPNRAAPSPLRAWDLPQSEGSGGTRGMVLFAILVLLAAGDLLVLAVLVARRKKPGTAPSRGRPPAGSAGPKGRSHAKPPDSSGGPVSRKKKPAGRHLQA